MASGESAMLVSSVVSAVNLSACLTVCLSLSLFYPCYEINVTVAARV